MALTLENNIDEVFEMLSDGNTTAKIAEHFGVKKGAVREVFETHPARANAAFKMAADSAVDEAERVLYDESIEPNRAREIASHLRWKAKMFDKQKYGDKIDVTSDDKPIGVSADILTAIAAKINA